MAITLCKRTFNIQFCEQTLITNLLIMPKGISVWMISFQMIRQGSEDECNSNVHRLCRQPRRVVKGMESAQVWRSTWLLANGTEHRSQVASCKSPSKGTQKSDKRTHFLMIPHPVPKGKLIIDPLMNKISSGHLLLLLPPGEVQTRNDH